MLAVRFHRPDVVIQRIDQPVSLLQVMPRLAELGINLLQAARNEVASGMSSSCMMFRMPTLSFRRFAFLCTMAVRCGENSRIGAEGNLYGREDLCGSFRPRLAASFFGQFLRRSREKAG